MIAKLRSKYEICCENYNGVLSTLWNQILVIFCNNLELERQSERILKLFSDG